MMTVAIGNITPNLEDAKGFASYDVVVKIGNAEPRTIWIGRIDYHKRKTGAAQLLRRIADAMEDRGTIESIITNAIGLAYVKSLDAEMMAIINGIGNNKPHGVLKVLKNGKVQKRCNNKNHKKVSPYNSGAAKKFLSAPRGGRSAGRPGAKQR